jgi:hypothetical protein
MAFVVLKVRIMKSLRFPIKPSLAINIDVEGALEKGFTFSRITKIPFKGPFPQ